jgi:hypothetical protein
MRNEFERKVLRKIYGRVLVKGQWRNRCNHKICNLYKEMELTRNMSLRRLHWVGHVMRKGPQESTERIRRMDTSWKARKKKITVDRDANRMLKWRNWW